MSVMYRYTSLLHSQLITGVKTVNAMIHEQQTIHHPKY